MNLNMTVGQAACRP